MRTIFLFYPFPQNRDLESGITIRLEEVAKWFKNNNFKVLKTDKLNVPLTQADLVYIMVSTKADSTSSQVASQILENQSLIVDLYTPIFLEKEATFSKWNPYHQITRMGKKRVVKNILSRGSHFLVANRRQKEYWLKTARSMGIKLKTNDISVLPTDAPKLSTVNRQPASAADRPSTVILWFGGIYPWMNPMPLIKSFSEIAPKHPNWKLRFVGGFHPKTGYLKLYNKVLEEAQKTIPKDQLEIIPWQKSDVLPNFLKDVAFAVHLPKNSPEDYYAHRVRLLTLLNAGIPIITAGNDLISHMLVKENAGQKVSSTLNLHKIILSKINDSKKLKLWSNNAHKVQEIYVQRESNLAYLKKILKTQN